MTVPDLYAFLSQLKLGVLSTIGPDNMPQSALVGIAVSQKPEIVFDTVKTSRKFPKFDRPVYLFVRNRLGSRTNCSVRGAC